MASSNEGRMESGAQLPDPQSIVSNCVRSRSWGNPRAAGRGGPCPLGPLRSPTRCVCARSRPSTTKAARWCPEPAARDDKLQRDSNSKAARPESNRGQKSSQIAACEARLSVTIESLKGSTRVRLRHGNAAPYSLRCLTSHLNSRSTGFASVGRCPPTLDRLRYGYPHTV